MSEKDIRQLAAVMITDIEGYTAMMQDDEDYANQQRQRHRKVLEEKADLFSGTVLHYYGDGAVTIFKSAYHAVKCAIQIQQEFTQSPKLPLRIGIHLGDIAYNEQEVFGDAVNIAARLESLSIAGGIMISEKVKQEVHNHTSIKTVSLGNYTLKNVKKPITIYAISNDGLTVPAPRDIEKKAGRISNKIAVLPFVNMSDEVGFDYFSDGLTEEIINGLARIKDLDVISRTSAFAYKGTSDDIRTIGEELAVSHVLEGSVRKHGDKIRVTAQLIETNAGFHLWSETYDKHLKDIFEIQDTITDEILAKFRQSDFYPSRTDQNTSEHTSSNQAYAYYLEGSFYWEKTTVTGIKKAISLYNKAIEEDPKFIKAYLDLAFSYCFLGILGQGSPRRAFSKAEKYLDKTKALDEHNTDRESIRGLIDLFLYNDFITAHQKFKKGVESEQASARSYYLYAMFLNIIGKNKLAIYWLGYALRLEPHNLMFNTALAQTFYFARRFQEALEQYDYTLQLESSYLPAIDGKGWVHVAMENYQEAHRVFEVYQNLISQERQNIPQLVYLAGRMGMGEVASHFLNLLQLGTEESEYNTTSFDVALIYLGMQQIDDVFFHLQRAAEDKIGKVFFIDSDPIWDKIKSDKRYKKILDDLGFNRDNLHQLSLLTIDQSNS